MCTLYTLHDFALKMQNYSVKKTVFQAMVIFLIKKATHTEAVGIQGCLATNRRKRHGGEA